MIKKSHSPQHLAHPWPVENFSNNGCNKWSWMSLMCSWINWMRPQQKTMKLLHPSLRGSPKLLRRGRTTSHGFSSQNRRDNAWTCMKHHQIILQMNHSVSHQVHYHQTLILTQGIPESTSDQRSINLSLACLPSMHLPLRNLSYGHIITKTSFHYSHAQVPEYLLGPVGGRGGGHYFTSQVLHTGFRPVTSS